jgi:hypothetical protein
MRSLEELIEQLKVEEEKAHKAHNFDAESAFCKAINLAEQLISYEIKFVYKESAQSFLQGVNFACDFINNEKKDQ